MVTKITIHICGRWSASRTYSGRHQCRRAYLTRRPGGRGSRRFMGVDEAKLQPADPPEMLIKRDAWVQLNKLNTIVIPHDPEDDNALQWACKENCPADQAVPIQSSGNEVVYLIDGKE